MKYGDEEATADESGLVFTLSTGDTVTISNAATVKNVADSAANNNTYDYVLTNAGQYETVTATYGTLTVTKRSVTLTSATDTKEYDGTPLKNATVTVSGDGFVKNEGATYDVTGSQTEVGGEANNNTFTYTLKTEDDETLEGNYDITPVYGTLTVTKSSKAVTISSADETWKYDGDEHSKPVYTVKYGDEEATADESAEEVWEVLKLSTGDTITITAIETAKITHVAENDVTNSFTYVLENADFYSNVTKTEGKLSITPRSVTLTSASDEKVYDKTPLTKNAQTDVTVSGDGFAPHEGASYTITGSQTLVGSSENTFTYVLDDNTKSDDYSINTVFGRLTVTDGTPDVPVQDDLVVTKSAEDKEYKLGETVTFEIKATNIYAEAKTITIAEQEGVTITSDSVFENVDPGASITATATYVIKEADILKGSFSNTATAAISDGITKEAVKEVHTEEPNGHLTITKITTSEPDNGEAYALDETITYEITVFNDGNLTITDITVTDELTGDEWTIPSLAPEATETFEAEYTVTEDDILAGEVVNVATGKGTSPDPDEPNVPVVPGEDPEPTVPKNGHLTITKETTSVTPENGYALGDTIEYKITVLNDGNLTITDITVTDELTGDEWTIANLAPGASKEFEAEYTVTEADILAGEVVNVATGEGTSPDPDVPDVPVDPGEDPEPTEDIDVTMPVDKTISNEPAGDAFKLGETIEYEIEVTNKGNVSYKNVTVEDANAEFVAGEGYELATAEDGSKTAVIAALAVKGSVTIKAEHVVTEADILAGKVVNTAIAKGAPIPDPKNPGETKTPEGEDTITTGDETDPDNPPPIEDKNGHLTITKETTSETPENGYGLGDTIEYKITVLNDGNLTITDITVTDELTGDEWTIASLTPGATETFDAEYTVTEADILAGKVVNVATGKGTSPDPDEPDVPVEPGEDPEVTEDIDVTMPVDKTISNEPAGDAFKLGETIEYEIKVTNNGNVSYKNVTVEDANAEFVAGEGYELATAEDGSKTAVIAALAVKGSVTIKAEHVVTEADILAGKVVNTAIAKGAPIPDPKNPGETKTPEGEDTITTGDETDPDNPPPIEDKNGHLTITKVTTSEPANGKTYALEETISYKITVLNDGNLTITDIMVTDELTGDEWAIASLAPGASEEFETEYKVTEDDILEGQVLNVATGKGTSPDPDEPDVPVEPGEDPEPTDPKNGHLTITKVTTSEPANGKTYALGETITYQITATNDGNLTLTNVTVTDELTGDEWPIRALAPDKSQTFFTTYTVTEADILAGEVLNVATGKGTSPDPDEPDVPVEPGEDPEPTDPKEGHLTIKKETTSKPANGKAYALGETITYKITATNDGNLTLTDITVTDELTGDEWPVASLAPDKSQTFFTAYTVTEKDILAGDVLNVATGKGTSPDPDEPDVPVVPGEDPEPTDDVNPSLSVVKTVTSTPEDETGYMEGETITYSIVVTNTGNVPYTNVKVEDELTGDEWTIPTLAVGESRTFTATYTVTEADVEARGVTNTATAKADDIPDPKDPDHPKTPEGKDTTPVTPTTSDLSGEKADYTLIIRYVNEDGKKMAKTFKKTYKDGDKYSVTSPVIKGYTADIKKVKGTITEDTEIEVVYSKNSYRLTIYYRDTNGNIIGTTYTDTLEYGDKYSVTSPALTGYTTVTGQVAGTMPDRNVQVTVYYQPVQAAGGSAVVIEDYATPLGLGNLSLSSGDCFE